MFSRPTGSRSHFISDFCKRSFVADDGTNGRELWELDSSGTASLVQDINSGSNGSYPRYLTAVGDKLYFVADDGTNGRELWELDSSGTASLVQDINSGSNGSYPINFTAVGDKLYFSASDGSGAKLWSLDTNPATPTVANALPDRTALVGESFNYQFAANTFTDADGDSLTYTASLANGQPLPTWLDFDADTRTFSSVSTPNDTQRNIHKIQVVASDGSKSVRDTFDLIVVNDAVDGSTNPEGYQGGNTDDGVAGGNTDDVIRAGAGNDIIGGLAGKDRLHGEVGADQIEGGDDDDFIDGGTDNDDISGSVGADFILGGSGSDTLSGGAGDDVLMGGADSDTLSGGTGVDRLSGFGEADVFVLTAGDTGNIIYDYTDGTDKFGLELDSFSETGVNNVFGALSIAQDGTSTTISYDSELLATVYNTTATDLTVDDFVAF